MSDDPVRATPGGRSNPHRPGRPRAPTDGTSGDDTARNQRERGVLR